LFENLKKLFATLDEKDQQRQDHDRRQADLAAVALMIAVSNADHQVDESEVRRILTIASETIALQDEDVETFFNEAEIRADASVSLYEFTEAINTVYEKQEKYRLIENMWRVAYADGVLDRYEDSTIRKVAELIYVAHSDFIRAKHAVTKST